MKALFRVAIVLLAIALFTAACATSKEDTAPDVTVVTVSYDAATETWTVPDGWTFFSIDSQLWNIYDENNERVAVFRINADGSLTQVEGDLGIQG